MPSKQRLCPEVASGAVNTDLDTQFLEFGRQGHEMLAVAERASYGSTVDWTLYLRRARCERCTRISFHLNCGCVPLEATMGCHRCTDGLRILHQVLIPDLVESSSENTTPVCHQTRERCIVACQLVKI